MVNLIFQSSKIADMNDILFQGLISAKFRFETCFFLGHVPGYLPFSHRFEASAAAKTTPVLHCHGSIDPVVRLPCAEAGVQRLKEAKSRAVVGGDVGRKS